MVAATNVYQRTCANRECRKEFTTTDSRKKTCGRQCTDREKYLRRLDKAAEKSSGKVVEISPRTSHQNAGSPELPRVENKPENGQPRTPEIDLIQTVAMAVGKAIAAELGIKFDRLGDKIEQVVEDMAKMQIEPAQPRTDLPKVTAPNPLIIEDDELPVVKAVKSEKAGQSSQNFLNSIMALNG